MMFSLGPYCSQCPDLSMMIFILPWQVNICFIFTYCKLPFMIYYKCPLQNWWRGGRGGFRFPYGETFIFVTISLTIVIITIIVIIVIIIIITMIMIIIIMIKIAAKSERRVQRHIGSSEGGGSPHGTHTGGQCLINWTLF